ncbi:hypothetical protein J2045_003421 [Peteryoungia aggregata LMG 23059]|uniref:Uncharacterized protein n=1 Tax=Peteryoungia aggregata LMG 23059 TaxID=1368425 RepID=A0ABU0GAJ3_9HYPH|nr:hypothetical protein [Peteryoungia aggregata]MDQ0422373.1 hypothetical protein [Peteryoungia aggregata LMG 23059]
MGTITRKIYKNSDEHYKVGAPLMTPQQGVTFPFDGHNWRFGHTAFDDQGDYFVIYRPDGDGLPIAADNMSLFDALLCSALSGLCANPSLLDEILDDGRKAEAPALLAGTARDIAMEAYDLARRTR